MVRFSSVVCVFAFYLRTNVGGMQFSIDAFHQCSDSLQCLGVKRTNYLAVRIALCPIIYGFGVHHSSLSTSRFTVPRLTKLAYLYICIYIYRYFKKKMCIYIDIYIFHYNIALHSITFHYVT